MTDTAPLTRDQLHTAMDRIEAAKRAVEENMAPLRTQLKPYEQQLAALDEQMEELLEPHGDYLGRCDACGAPLLRGDQGFRCSDGPIFCAEHAPTYGEMLAEIREFPVEEWEEEEWGPLAEAIAGREALVAERGADTPCLDKL